MPDTEKRNQRKDWRNRNKLYDVKKKNTKQLETRLQENSPPSTPIPDEFIADDGRFQAKDDGRKKQGRLLRRKALNREISVLKTKLEKDKRKVNIQNATEKSKGMSVKTLTHLERKWKL